MSYKNDKVDASRRFKYFQHYKPELLDPFSDEPYIPDSSATWSSYLNDISLDVHELVIIVEHCFDCANHGNTLRHNPLKYKSFAHRTLQNLLESLYLLDLNARVGAMRSLISEDSRIGAFEISIAYRNHNGDLHFDQLHSKLKSLEWPNPTELSQKLKDVIRRLRVPRLYHSPDVQHVVSDWSACTPSQPDWELSIVEPEVLKKVESRFHMMAASVCVPSSPSSRSSPKKGKLVDTPAPVLAQTLEWIFDNRRDESVSRNLSEGSMICVKGVNILQRRVLPMIFHL